MGGCHGRWRRDDCARSLRRHAGAAGLLASGRVQPRRWPTGRSTPTCSASRWWCGAAPDGAGPGHVGPVRAPRHGAVARLGQRRRARLPLSRLAVPRRRPLRGHPAAGRTRPGAGQGPDRGRSAARNGTAWSGWPWRSRAGRCPRCRNWRTGSWAVVTAGPYRWQCDAARQVENFTDFGHFPWVHPGLLGDPDRPVVPPPRGPHRGTRAALLRSSGRRRPTATTSRSSATSRPARRNGAAATNCTCPTRSRCGWAGAASAAWCTSSPRSRSRPTAAPGTW